MPIICELCGAPLRDHQVRCACGYDGETQDVTGAVVLASERALRARAKVRRGVAALAIGIAAPCVSLFVAAFFDSLVPLLAGVIAAVAFFGVGIGYLGAGIVASGAARRRLRAAKELHALPSARVLR